ncbi:MAG: UbiA family prenyltransferase, partial [Elusimicrobiota bacterium]
MKNALRALRPHQWVKNLLIFAPLAAAHRLTEPARFYPACAAFAAFSFCASGVYVLNDLADLEADRQHPRKRHRPFASGVLPLAWGLALAPGALAAAAASALFLPRGFQAILTCYFMAALSYSAYFKRKVLLDVILLAGLYT